MASLTHGSDLTWRDHLAGLSNLWPLFRMLWDVSPVLFAGTVFVRFARSVLPMVLLWVSKQILDGILAALRGHGDLKLLWRLLALELALTLVGDMLSHANTVLDGLMGERFTTFIATRLIDHVAKLDLATMEDPVFYDKLERVRGQAIGRMFLLTSIMNAAQESLTLFALSTGLIVFSPWLMVLLTVSSIPTFIGEVRFSKLSYSAFFKRTPQRRELEYLRLLGSWVDSAKEVRIFRLALHLSSKYRHLSGQIYQENKSLAVKRARGGWILGAVATLGYYAGYVMVFRRVLGGAITLGAFTFLTGSLARARASTQRIFACLNDISEQAALLSDLFCVFRMAPSIRSLPNGLPLPSPIREGFEFRNVSFAYPGAEAFVVRNINFHISPCEKIALVGENGAGKTTIIKLLSRMYDPTSGQILLDGIDLRHYDLSALRSMISVIFQDFMRYDLPVRENIAVGNLEALSDDDRLGAAARKGGAEKLINRFPMGYDQVLGRRFKDGTDLSGGEWQKIALARAFVSDAQLIILDEPTASLDAQAEDDFFKRFREEHQGCMVVLVSHRLSTVRRADKIVVLEHGEIRDQGTHAELVALGGLYADLFSLQAAAFL
jgi:ATP-binding cassette, subfamily B, bacterial